MKRTFSIKTIWYGMILLLTLIPMVVISPWILIKIHSYLLKDALQVETILNVEIKEHVNHEIARFITLLENKSDPMAYTLTHNVDRNLLAKLLEKVISREASIHELYLLKPDGKTLLGFKRIRSKSSDPTAHHHRTLVDLEDTFDPDSPQLAIPLHGRTYISSATEKFSFSIAVPVGSAENPVAVLLAKIHIEELWEETIPMIASRSGTISYLVDSRGTLLTTPTKAEKYRKGDLVTHLEIVRNHLTRKHQTKSYIYSGITGESVFGDIAHIDALNWAIISEIPEKQITRPILVIIAKMSAIFFITMLLSGSISLLFVGRILDSFKNISTAFDKAADGNYSKMVFPFFILEFKTLLNNFNNMTAKISNHEEELREKDRFQSALLNDMITFVGILDPSGVIIFVNNTPLKAAGIKLEDVVGKKFFDTPWWSYSDEAREVVKRNIEECVSGKSIMHDIQFQAADGSLVWAEFSMHPIYDEQGVVQYLIPEGRVIAERKKAEDELKESEQRFRQHIQDLDMIAVGLDNKGNITYANSALSNLLTLSAKKLIGKNWVEYFVPERYQSIVKDVHNLHAKKDSFLSFESPILLPNGEERVIKWNNTALKDKSGNVCEVMSIGEDITKRKQTEDELRKLSRAVEQSPAAVVITDTEGKIEYVNPKFCEITGYTKEEVIGASPRILGSGEISSEEYKELWETITSGGEWRGEFHNKKKNGELYWEFASVSPIKDQSGTITNFLAVKEDITERKRIGEELSRERKHLEETVKTRTQELQNSLIKVSEVNIHLEAANQAKTRFLSTMSHELRTPLNAILGFSDLLNQKSFGKLNEEQLGFVKQIDNSGKHLLTLISDLLDITKIDAGVVEVELSEISANEFIESAVVIMSSQFKEKQIRLEATIDPALTVLMIDIRKCKQIIFNLLSNALKYTPEGGSVNIRVVKKGNRQIRIEVSDTGIGIKKDSIKKIFSEFYQADRVRDEQLGGTGIGLALARRLVEMQGGKIWVESVEKKGSTFFFTIPKNQ